MIQPLLLSGDSLRVQTAVRLIGKICTAPVHTSIFVTSLITQVLERNLPFCKVSAFTVSADLINLHNFIKVLKVAI
jgi:hypothetical protein